MGQRNKLSGGKKSELINFFMNIIWALAWLGRWGIRLLKMAAAKIKTKFLQR